MVSTKKIKKRLERDALISKGLESITPYERETSLGSLSSLKDKTRDIEEAREDRATRLAGGMKKSRKIK